MKLISLANNHFPGSNVLCQHRLPIRSESNWKDRSITVDVLNNRIQRNNMPRRPSPPSPPHHFHGAFANLPLGFQRAFENVTPIWRRWLPHCCNRVSRTLRVANDRSPMIDRPGGLYQRKDCPFISFADGNIFFPAVYASVGFETPIFFHPRLRQ